MRKEEEEVEEEAREGLTHGGGGGEMRDGRCEEGGGGSCGSIWAGVCSFPLVSHGNLSILHSSSHSCCPASHTGHSPPQRHSGSTGRGTDRLETHTHTFVGYTCASRLTLMWWDYGGNVGSIKGALLYQR